VTALYDVQLKTIDGRMTTLDEYRGKVLLVVNVASRCRFTRQYEALETLYKKYKNMGFAVLAFPCNQFGRQEPGDENEIRRFCAERFSVTFPMFAKIDVNGANTHPLYRYLKSAKKGLLGREAIAWNFTKFLITRNGEVVRRYGSLRTPENIEKDLAALV
jgi:glutathione peroxidase